MKVPFGLHKDTKKFIGIDEAENGLACNCICPSCDMQLKARQGEENEHHFSHHKLAQVECKYSYWVAVRSMAKQLMCDKNLHIHKKQTMVFPVVPWKHAMPMHITEIILSPRVDGYQFDAMVKSSIGTYYIYLLTPSKEDVGRTRSHYSNQNRNNTFSPYLVMEIDIGLAKHHNNKASKHLRSLLCNEMNKKWFSTHSSYLDYLIKDEPTNKVLSSPVLLECAKPHIAKERKHESHSYSNKRNIFEEIGYINTSPSTRTIQTVHDMVKFYNEMHQNINKVRDDIYDYKEIVSRGDLTYVGCYGEFYCMAFVGLCHVVYTVEENKVKLLPIRHQNNRWKLSKLLREYAKKKAEDMF